MKTGARRSVNDLYVTHVQGCITYAAAQEDVEHVCQSILASGVKALGFDIEWHVTYRRALALFTPLRKRQGAWKIWAASHYQPCSIKVMLSDKNRWPFHRYGFQRERPW